MTLTKLPFTHGIEMELQLVGHDGHWIKAVDVNLDMAGIFKRIVDDCRQHLTNDLYDPSTPAPIKAKTKGFRIEEHYEEKHNRGRLLIADYRLGERIFPAEIVGRDAHGAGATWIL